MKSIAAFALFSAAFLGTTSGAAQTTPATTTTLQHKDISAVAPALAAYYQRTVLDGVWDRPGLDRRDRSLVTLAALIARNQATELSYYMARALDSGVKPRELSETITHLAFYSGFPNALAAIEAAKAVFEQRGIGVDQLPGVSPALLPINEAAEAARETSVRQRFGAVAPGVVRYTSDVLFHDLWLRPDLAPRDRSLVTVSALVASGQLAQLSGHLNRALDNGLTQAQASEAMTQLAFYAGWPNVFSALPIAKDVFEKRPH